MICAKCFLAAILLFISVDASSQTCATVLDDDFSSSSGWTTVGNGDVSIVAGVCNFGNVYAGSDNRVHKTLPTTLSNTYWKAECKLTFNGQNPNGNGAGGELISLTAGTLPFMTYDASQSYSETTQDGIAVILTSSSATDENRNNWFFLTESKRGNNRSYTLASSIYASSAINTYYIRLERTSGTTTQMSICTDSLYTQHVAGSPSQHTINASISGLSVIQHASNVPGTNTRMLNGTIDNDFVCHYGDVGLLESIQTSTSEAAVYPNPATQFIWTTLVPSSLRPVQYVIVSMNGTLIQSDVLKSNNPIDISQLAQGSYLLMMIQDEKVIRARFIKCE
jgi:hypothetical protein